VLENELLINAGIINRPRLGNLTIRTRVDQDFNGNIAYIFKTSVLGHIVESGAFFVSYNY